MVRFSRVNAIWKKELTDTLRDRRTVIAMVVVPIVLYPGLMLASLMAVELKFTALKQETYTVAVRSDAVKQWLTRLIDTDLARRESSGPSGALDERAERAATQPTSRAAPLGHQDSESVAKADVRSRPPPFRVAVFSDIEAAVRDGGANVGLDIDGPLPTPEDNNAARVQIVVKQKDVRSEIAVAGIEGILDRVSALLVRQRLARANLTEAFYRPIEIVAQDVATDQEINGWLAGMMIPPILIVLTITGTIYPAIDLTAGERERGTLETLMSAPVPALDLITGKFIVVTLIGLISAMLNLLAFGGTMYFGGMGSMLTNDWNLSIPPSALPWVFVALVPLAVMFGAILLAVSSFARSFKEAQNYVMPVIVAAMLPAFVAVIPGTRLEGPILVIPVANIVVLTRELFMGHFRWEWIGWVTLSTSLYAAAAVAVAARLFGQEAVLFADSTSLKTVFQRRLFKPRETPTAATALLAVAIAYPLNYFIQVSLAPAAPSGSTRYLLSVAGWLILMFAVAPVLLCGYLRIRIRPALSLRTPPVGAIAASLLLGTSTWILAKAWVAFQYEFMPYDADAIRMLEEQYRGLERLSPWLILVILAIVPGIVEELFFRGFALSGVRSSTGPIAAALITAIAFGVFHQDARRLVVTITLGLILATLVIRFGSIWPAMIAHVLHNGITTLTTEKRWLLHQWLDWPAGPVGTVPPTPWIYAAVGMAIAGLALIAFSPQPKEVVRPESV